MSDPIRCWCWNEGSRKTAPSIHWIREISATTDGGRHGAGVNGYPWSRVQPIADGHPDAATDAVLESVYVARWQARNTADAVVAEANKRAESVIKAEIAATFNPIEQPRPSALSRIWAILRGRG